MSRQKLCPHGQVVCEKCLIVTDDAKRMSDAVNGMLSFHQPWELRMKYAAVKLEDGTVGSEVYDTIGDARKYTANSPYKHAYFAYRNYMGGLTPEHAQIFLSVHRLMPDTVRQGDPDKGRAEAVMPIESTDRLLAMQRLATLRQAIGNN